MMRALIVGLGATELSSIERAFLRDVQPCGIILFARNCASCDQVRRLVADARDAVGGEGILVLIDQEGGRVQRLRPPLGRALPSAAAYALRYRADPKRATTAAEAVAGLLAADLRALGIDTNCAPVADVPAPGAHEIIGDRAYGRGIDEIVALASAVARGFVGGGVVPVVKHIPGHGRANADSHLTLPRVATPLETLAATDFVPFQALSGAPAAMTAHVVFEAVDPVRPASVSPVVHAEIIRGYIGFDGLLMSDDLSMKALEGPYSARAAAVIAAGSDVALHCNGNLAEMTEAADGAGALSGEADRRFRRARSVTMQHGDLDRTAAERDLAWVIGAHA